jgi:hypothetical protein
VLHSHFCSYFVSYFCIRFLGDDFTGRPTSTTDGTSPSGSESHSKTAQKILAAQKQPPAPTLFIGNLGFEATEDSIRGMLDAHRKKNAEGKQRTKLDDADKEPKENHNDEWIRKIRLGTFEDSGKCKG